MKYMIREVYNCRRGKAPEIIGDLKIINDLMMSQGVTNGKIYVDITERMDTVIHEYEVESLDQFFTFERGFYVNPDADTTRLIDHYNDNTVAGRREIYEVLV